jgi:hypothetical protein
VNNQNFTRTNSFTVVVREINTAPQLTIPANQQIDELSPLNVSASATDVDLPANPLTFSLLSAPEGMTIDAKSGLISWMPSEAQGPNTYTVGVVITDESPSAANAQHLSATNSFTVRVNEVNSPPVLPPQSSQIIEELTTLIITNTAVDTDLPVNTLTYILASAPTNAVMSAEGVITWTPTEAQGPSTNTFVTVVADNGIPSRSATNVFTVIVNEVNSAPVLPALGSRTIDELTTLVVTNTATDSDLPVNRLTYALASAPTNAVISSEGIISWTPTEAQGPATNTFITIVTDDGVPSRSATNSFTVVVNEVNTRPTLQAIPDQSVHYGTPISIQAVASDPDLPRNLLTFSIAQGPTDLSINPTNGLITWTPAQTQVGTHPVQIRVSDDGTPSLSDTVTFQITVSGAGSRLDISELVSGLFQVTISGDIGYEYELQKSVDLVHWDKLFQFRLSTSPLPYIDPESAGNSLRFYRLKLINAPGQ